MQARWRGWLVVVALFVGAGCLGYLGSVFSVSADWSAGATASLSPTSQAIVERLQGPVEITSYARPGGDVRRQIAAFVGRYQRLNPYITLIFIDPEQDPQAVRAAGITVNGELVVRYRGSERRLTVLSERSLSNALESLARGGDRIVAFVTGDGERAPVGSTPYDLGSFVKQLEQRGVRALPLDFAQVSQVPLNTRLVVLASPMQALSKGAVKALVDYVRFGGNLLWLTEPNGPDLGLSPLAEELGIQVLPGMLVDGQGSAIGLKDPRLVATTSYPPHELTRGFDLTTVFPRVAALAQASLGQWKVTSLLRSGAQSWNRRQPIDAAQPSTIRFDAQAGDTKGPLSFGLALTRLSPNPSHDQQRVVVIGGGSFLANAWLGQAGNRAFGERLFNWLMDDDALIGVPPRHAAAAPLALGQQGLNLLTAGFLVAFPLLLVLLGLGIAWRRRRA